MDVGALAGAAWHELKEVVLFLTAPGALPPDVALALYVSSSGGQAGRRAAGWRVYQQGVGG